MRAQDRITRRAGHRVYPVAAVAIAAGLLTGQLPGAAAATQPTRVLRVGSWHGVRGNESTIAAAVAALHPGDWLLIGPGDYHPRMDYQPSQRSGDYPAAVLVTTADVHIRGMDRNRVIIDGTKPGSPACSAAPADQDYGPLDSSGQHRGRNGVEALKVNGVSFDNLTVCNFLAGTADTGNEIWWNGGDDGGKIGLGSWWGSYLSATSTFYRTADTAAAYGLFVSNARGPGEINWTYANNFSDAGVYIGACPNCNAVIDHARSADNALGYSGTNSGGNLIVENSEFDHNKTGFVTNSQNSADPPSPQDGGCPNGGTGPTGTHSCWIFRDNFVYDNNNPDVPQIGDAAIGPVGTGVVLAGSRHDTVLDNRIVDNGAWGVLTTIFPDTGAENPHNTSNCHGGVLGGTILGQQVPCLFDDWGNRVAGNTFKNNGRFGNVTNGDLADLSQPPAEKPGAPGNCFDHNTEADGRPASSWPVKLQTTEASCDNSLGYPDTASFATLAVQVACNTQVLLSCPKNVVAHYPRQTKVVMVAMPHQQTMPDPCAGVPVNPWCPAAGRAGGGPALRSAGWLAGGTGWTADLPRPARGAPAAS